jgi:hypothetical protein
VIIQTPHGPAPPLVTGTFGSADFFHSVLGEATESVLFFFTRNIHPLTLPLKPPIPNIDDGPFAEDE